MSTPANAPDAVVPQLSRMNAERPEDRREVPNVVIGGVKRVVYPRKSVLRSIADRPEDRVVVRNFVIGGMQRVEYPSQWFGAARNVRMKPHLSVPKSSQGCTLASLRASIISKIAPKTISPNEVKVYLTTLMNAHPSTLADDWTSFGRVIGAKGKQVSLQDLYTLQLSDEIVPLTTVVGVSNAADDVWLAIYLTSFYRLGHATDENYRMTLANRIKECLSGHNAPLHANPADAIASYRHWIGDKWYCALIAFIDMFLVKFPKHRLAKIRIGTQTSRHKDCAALIDLTNIVERSGLDFVGVAMWVWKKKVADDLERIRKDGEEIDTLHSYMPYMIDLRLCGKSPYSASTNPSLHAWVSIALLVAGMPRSKHAKMIGTVEIGSLSILGSLLGYAMLTRSDAPEDGTDTPPNNMSGTEWFYWFQTKNQMMPVRVKDRLQRICQGLVDTRPGTYGQYMKKYIF